MNIVLPYVSPVDLMSFTKRLALMLRSGISLGEALLVLLDQTDNLYLRPKIKQIVKAVQNGKTLEAALGLYPEIFSSLYLHLIRVGEQAGTLDKNLEYLATKLKKDLEFRSKVLSGLLYPIIVLSLAGIVAVGLTIFVLPQMADLFRSLDVDLPLSTKILLGLAEIVKVHGLLLGLGIFGLVIGFLFLIRLPAIKIFWHRLLLNLPIVGKFMREIYLAQFCRNLGVMLKAGIPLAAALLAEQASSSNLAYTSQLRVLAKAVDSGMSIGEAIRTKQLNLFPILLGRMISIGEKTGSLDSTLIYLADYYEEVIEDSARNMATLLEPIILILVGLMVAFVAMAIISPIYELTGSIKR